MQLDKIFSSLGMAGNTAELVTLLLVLLAISAGFWLLIGRFRLHNFLINIYISVAMLQVLPKAMLDINKSAGMLYFLAFLVFLTFMNRYLFDIHQNGSGLALWQVFVLSFLEVGLIVSIALPFFNSKDLLKFISKDTLTYFTSPWAKIIWMIAPLVFLIIVNKRGK